MAIFGEISEAASGERWRFEGGQKLKPRAWTPREASCWASERVVTPQIFREGDWWERKEESTGGIWTFGRCGPMFYLGVLLEVEGRGEEMVGRVREFLMLWKS